MNWLNPGMAWWLLLVPALVALYMFRPRPTRKVIPSLRLWRDLPEVTRPRLRLRKPPLSLLLLLQALLLVAGAFALMQPAMATPQGRQMVILLDASGSMQTVDSAGTRFEQALAQARNVADSMRLQDRTTLLWVGANITTLCSACNQGDLRDAISKARPGAGAADMTSALNLAQGLAARSPQGSVQTVVISDGAFGAIAEGDIPTAVRFIQVGSRENNVAITTLSARQPPDGSPSYSAFARIDNLGGSQASIEVTSYADTIPQPARRLNIQAGGYAELIWQLSPGTARFTVNISPNDALPADNSAALFLPSGQYRVLIASPQAALYARALSGVPAFQAVTQPVTGSEQPAFSIIEGQLPPTLPGGSLLLVNPQGALLAATGDVENQTPSSADASSPILAGIDLRPLVVQRARQIITPSWLQPVVQAAGGPLLMAGEKDGQRIAVLTFDPTASNLPKLAAFPLLLANLADWLYPLADTQSFRPGDPIILPPGSIITTPAGEQVRVGSSGRFTNSDEQGIYSVQAQARQAANSPSDRFAVNMADAQESSLSVQSHPELNRQPAAGQQRMSTQEFWLPLVVVALALSGAEWLFYCLKRGRA